MSDARASTHKLNSCKRIAHSRSDQHQPSCCGTRPEGIMREREEVTIILKDSRSQPGTLRGVGQGLCDRGLPRKPISRSSETRSGEDKGRRTAACDPILGV